MIEEEIITPQEAHILQEAEDELLPAVINSEVNLLKFPFFALSWRGLKNKTKTEYRFVEERDGERAELLWQVTSNSEYGYPNPFDGRVKRAVDAMICETIEHNKYPLENPIQFSIYGLARLMGFHSDNSRLYQNIRESIERIAATTVKSEGAFWLKDEKVWLRRVFHIYEEVVFKGQEKTDGTIAETNYLWLGRYFLQSINSQYVAPLDYQYLVGLKSDLAGRLYELLGRKFYGLPARKDQLLIGYVNLCESLPIKPQRYYSDAKRYLDPAHQELLDTGFLAKVVYQCVKGKKELRNITYYMGKRAEKEKRQEFRRRLSVDEQLLLPLSGEMKDEGEEITGVAKELHERGIRPKSLAVEYAESFPEEYISEKIKMFDSGIIEEAGGLIRALDEDWKLTEEQKRQASRQSRNAQSPNAFGGVQRLRELEAKAREIQEERFKDGLQNFPSDEEWVEQKIQTLIAMRQAKIQAVGGQPYTEKEIEEFREERRQQIPRTDDEKRNWLRRHSSEYDLDKIVEELKKKE